MSPTDGPARRWSMVDLAARSRSHPAFGLASGTAPESGVRMVRSPVCRSRSERRNAARTGGRIDTTWGTRNPNAGQVGYRGDEFFDYFFHGTATAAVRGRRTQLGGPSAPTG